MSLFGNRKNKAKENNQPPRLSWDEQVKRLSDGQIDIQTFVDFMQNTKVFYSTPAGNDKSGNPQLYLLSDNNSDIHYFPIWLTDQHCADWFNSVGRNGFMIIEGTLGSMLSTLDANEMLKKLGVLIEVNTNQQVIIPPLIRASVSEELLYQLCRLQSYSQPTASGNQQQETCPQDPPES